MSCPHWKVSLKESDRYFVKTEEKLNNCLLCLVNESGPMTQQKTGEYLGLTKIQVYRIEQKALKHFKRKMHGILKK